MQDDDSEGSSRNVLLARKPLVDGDQRIEMSRHGIEEVAIVEIPPGHLGSRADFVAGQVCAQHPRDTRVEEHSHDLRR